MTLKPCPCCKKPQTTRNAEFLGSGTLVTRYLAFNCRSCGSTFALVAGMASKTLDADLQTELVLRALGPRLAVYYVNQIPVVSEHEVWYIGLEGYLDLERKTLTLNGPQKAIEAFLSDYNEAHGLMDESLEAA